VEVPTKGDTLQAAEKDKEIVTDAKKIAEEVVANAEAEKEKIIGEAEKEAEIKK
jgi:F0F1-type ATP synthase membrane subunit b/b'